MNRHVPSSVLRVAFGCAIGIAAIAGAPVVSEPAFAQEAPAAQSAPEISLAQSAPEPAPQPAPERHVAPPGLPARKPPVPQATAKPAPPASTAQPFDPRRPLTVPPDPGLVARPVGPGGRPISPPPALNPNAPPDLATGPIPEAPADRPNVPPPEGVQLGTPAIPPAPPGEPPVIAAVPSLPGERPKSVVPPRPAAPAAPIPADIPAGTEFRIVFPDDMAQTLSPADTRLLSGIAARLQQDENTRLEVLGYATGTPETNRESRRLSLERALAVRSYLIDQGVRRTRIDVRALGPTAQQGPADRVDLLLVK
jgi:outer membrane protein OmpA-like peptidoglycan-associated protein